MSSRTDAYSNDNENTCVVCFKNVEIYSVGVCDHPVCYECSTRMRVLCRQNECPICRQDLPKVVFTKEVDQFSVLKPKADRHNFQDRKIGILFSSGSIQRAYYTLLEHNCSICQGPSRWPFRNFQQLKDHMRREHELFYCDLCVANLKIFTFERRCYTRSELALHRRKGDADNKSHRGHPLCEFCDTRYMDSDELFRHLRRDHLYCHFCDADGKHQYYNSYADLRGHFLEEHYLCEEGDCKNEQFTSVFRTDIDLRAHIANVHSRHMSKSATKQARTLELEFTLAPRPRDQMSRGRRYQRNERDDEQEGAMGYDNYYMEPGGNQSDKDQKNRPFVNSMSSAEFPSLGSASDIVPQSRPTSNLMFTSKITPSVFNGEEFPSLGGNTGPARSQNVTITAHSKVAQKGATSNRAPEVTITRTIRGSQKLDRNSQNFPVLGGSSVGNSTVRLSVSSNAQSDRPQSARPNLSIHVTNQSSGAITTKITTMPTSTIQVRPKSTEAFPALSAAPIPEAQWVPQKTKKSQELKNMKVATPPVLPPSSLTDFPTLAKTGKNDLKTKKRSSVTMPVSNSWVNLNHFNSESRNAITVKPESDSSKSDAKPKVEKKDGNNKPSNKNVKKDAKFKMTEPTKINHRESTNGEAMKTNEKRREEPKIEDKPNKTQSKSSEFKVSEKYESKTIDEKSKIDEKTKTKKKKQKNNEINTSASNESNNENASRDGGAGLENDTGKNGIVKKRSELKIEPLEAPDINGIDEFPSLGQKKPPPGFNVVKPPPGFDAVTRNSMSLSNDLTFTNSSGQSYSIVPTPTHNYHLPPNFEIRNKSLIDNFMAVNKSGDAICEFKRYSTLFRDGSYTALKYYNHCRSFLGDDFERIFPELLVLLPDIAKQQELYKIHLSNGIHADLEVCLTCNQVVLSRDLRSHLSNHTLENNFPILRQTNEPASNYWKK